MLLPVWAEPRILWPGHVQDTLFVLDVSESMNVRDVDYPLPHSARLELAKAATREAMAALPCGSRMALALFAGEETLVLFEPLEICRHFPAMDEVVARLATRMRWIGNSRVEAGLLQAIAEARSRRLNLVFVSDGDEMPHRTAARTTVLEKFQGKLRGALFSVGGDVPLPVPRVDGEGVVTGYWTPQEAVREGFYPNLVALADGLEAGAWPAGALDEVSEHLSAARPAYLETMAQAAGLAFRRVQRPQDMVGVMRTPGMARTSPALRDARAVCALGAALLVLAGWFWPAGGSLRRRTS